MFKRFFFSISILSIAIVSFSQPDRWQQKVKYVMDIDMNVADQPVYG